MTENDQKEQLSIAYLRAVAAAANLKTSKEEIDDDSIDITLGRTGGGGMLRSPKCDVQLKATSQDVVSGDHIHFPLPRKNYDDLRSTNVCTPRILVVLLLPTDSSEWLAQDHEALCMRRCAYWYSLRGLTATPNETNVTVRIPRSQMFTKDALVGIMDRIGNGGQP